MCYDTKAQPPDLPEGIGGGGSGEELTLTASDGNKFSAFAAHADQSKGAQILIYPDVRGLHQFYKDLAMRFADAGYSALAMDYFGRSAGLSARDETFEFMPHVGLMTWPTFTNDVRAAVAHIRSQSTQPIFSVGFCMGGGLCLYSSMTPDLGLKGVIGFYAGMRRAWDESKGTLPDAGRHAKLPVLGLFGGADPGIPTESVNRLDEVLDEAGVPHSIHSYEGAPHSFFDRSFDQWKDYCDDAWRRMFEFVEKNK
jgi:carboxymethylenebutenolidase